MANGEVLNMSDFMYDNPVGKDIYLITNTINGKVYVGQSIHPQKRFQEHCNNHTHSIIHKAIQKYGKENFKLTILEKNVVNYNEKEKYWISFYNCIVPNGYNITPGGENPPVLRGINNPNSNLTSQKILEIKKDLQKTSLSYNQLAKKYNTNKKTILRINNGISYYEKDESYPIRSNSNSSYKLSDEQVEEINEILRYTYIQYSEIAKRFNVSESLVKQINLGMVRRIPGHSYPIRKYKNSGKIIVTYNQVSEIHELLKNTDLSLRQIGRLYDIDHKSVILINSGKSKRYYREEEFYPLR